MARIARSFTKFLTFSVTISLWFFGNPTINPDLVDQFDF